MADFPKEEDFQTPGWLLDGFTTALTGLPVEPFFKQTDSEQLASFLRQGIPGHRDGFADSYGRIGGGAMSNAHRSVAGLWLSILSFTCLLLFGCVTPRDLQEIRTDVSNQLSVLRTDIAQVRQGLETTKADVALLRSLGMVVDAMKGRLDGIQTTVQGLQTESESHRTAISTIRGDFREFKVAHEAVAKETDRLRGVVGSLEQGMIFQLQVEVNLARDRIKQLEQIIENLQRQTPPKEGASQPKL
ncbi:hypothetical protein [Nitrospira calida]